MHMSLQECSGTGPFAPIPCGFSLPQNPQEPNERTRLLDDPTRDGPSRPVVGCVPLSSCLPFVLSNSVYCKFHPNCGGFLSLHMFHVLVPYATARAVTTELKYTTGMDKTIDFHCLFQGWAEV